MGQFIGSCSVEMFGEDVDINDDKRLRELLRQDSLAMVAPISPVKAKHILVDALTDIRLVGVKFAFVLNQSKLAESLGIGMQTCQDIYDQLALIGGLKVAPQSPALLGEDGKPLEDTPPPAPVLPDDPGLPPDPPAPTDEL